MGTMKKIVDTLIDMESNDVSKRSEVAEKHGFQIGKNQRVMIEDLL